MSDSEKMSTQSHTPRTDGMEYRGALTGPYSLVVDSDVARSLERELAETKFHLSCAQADREELRAALEDTTSLLELLAKQLENMGSEKKPVLWTAHKTARALLAKVST